MLNVFIFFVIILKTKRGIKMPLTQNPKYIKEPTDLQCGQAVLAMLSDKTVDEIIKIVKTDRETTLKQMFFALESRK